MPTLWQKLSKFGNPVPSSLELAQSQRQWLLNCIKRNRNTRYGAEHGFSRLGSISDYQNQVPLVTYEDVLPYIREMERGEQNCLFKGKTIAFERTSGTQGGPKLIPYSAESLLDFRRAVLPWLTNLTSRYQIESGFAYWAISPATNQPEVTSAGIVVGLPEATYLGEDLVDFFRGVSAVPTWVGEIPQIADWQLVTLYHLVCCNLMSIISVWSPTFLLSLVDALATRKDELETVLSKGFEVSGQRLPANHPAHDRLKNFYLHNDLKILWPNLKVISCWADASSKPFCDDVKKRFAYADVQAKGLLMTEAVVTTPDKKGNPILAATSGFYEFIDQGSNLKLAHELKTGEKYEVVITTSGGLYRYRTSDRVTCNGYKSGLPILQFTGRESSSDLVGEKLTEAFANACLEDISGFRMLLPIKNNAPGYVLILENQADIATLASQVEARLCENPQYAYARKLEQLKPLVASRLKNPMQMYLDSPLHGDSRLGDIKIPSLCLKASIFDDLVEPAA
jgi:hypothetical protein